MTDYASTLRADDAERQARAMTKAARSTTCTAEAGTRHTATCGSTARQEPNCPSVGLCVGN